MMISSATSHRRIFRLFLAVAGCLARLAALVPGTGAWPAPSRACASHAATERLRMQVGRSCPALSLSSPELLALTHYRDRGRFVLWAASQDDGDAEDETFGAAPDDEAETIVTAEMFWRDVLADPTSPSPPSSAVVKRPAGGDSKSGQGKKSASKFKEYRVLDNRDTLPFSVRVSTPPDPYTHPEIKKRRQAQASPKNNNSNGKRATGRRADAIENRIASKLYAVKDGKGGNSSPDARSTTSSSSGAQQPQTLLGEFALDKHTTTGDLLEIGQTQYRVVSHRCLYKYAGGKRFVMTQKILHVKEVGRYQAEEYLRRQWNAEAAPGDSLQEP